MSYDRDLIGYGAHPPDPKWPGGARVAINFVILAFIIFLMVKQMNRLKREAPPAPPAATPEDVVLLREIRDSLKR